VPKDALGARIALAIQASAGASAVLSVGPVVTSAHYMDGGKQLVLRFSVAEAAGGLVLSNNESCPSTMLDVYCTGAGFEVRGGSDDADGVWVPVRNATAGADGKSVVLEVSAKPDRVRYAYADWPLVMVRNRVGGLPARIFDIAVH
jgi:hypothetical protein